MPKPRVRGVFCWGTPQRIALAHGVERIGALGRDAVLVGNRGGDLHFTSVRLGEAAAHPTSGFVQCDAAQGDQRTQAFFNKPDADAADASTIGLPIVRGETSAAVLYLRNQTPGVPRPGTLDAASCDDRCVANCVDWYGNARPIFLTGRMFAAR